MLQITLVYQHQKISMQPCIEIFFDHGFGLEPIFGLTIELNTSICYYSCGVNIMKAVFFDFDGTLTYKSPNIWKEIWKFCGYDTNKLSFFAKLYHDFMNGRITHQRWCDLTCLMFIAEGLQITDVELISKKLNPIEGLTETLQALKNNGYSLHIVSGSIDSVIRSVLGDNVKYFDSINANTFIYDEDGYLTYIQGTNYDFEGKAKFITEYKQLTNSNGKDLIFIGNGDNDEWAHLSGCKTICINPENTDSSNTSKWHKCLDNVSNLTDILPLFGDIKLKGSELS